MAKSNEEPAVRNVSRESLVMLATLLDVTADQLIVCRDLLNKGAAYYGWEVPKASGGTRTITSPVEELKKAQRQVLHRLFYMITVHTIAQGFVRDRDIMTNAGRHAKARTLLNLDLKDAFPSVRTLRVEVNLTKPITRILRVQFGKSIAEEQIADIIWMLVKLCTYQGCLPQGAPTSPALLNIVCLNLDRKLYEIAVQHGLTVTRYADDITFSTVEDEIPGDVRQQIRSTISNAGWKINQLKTKYLRRRVGNALEVTGLLLQEGGKVSIPERRRENYRAFFCALLEQDSITEHERATAIGIVVYASRVYNGRLPSGLLKLWVKVKAKFGIADTPPPKTRSEISVYMPDIRGQEGE